MNKPFAAALFATVAHALPRKSLVVALAAVAGLNGVACASPAGEAEGDEAVAADESNLTGCLPFGLGPKVSGPVEQKYLQLGGCLSFLGAPVHETRATPDGKGGLFAAFLNGSIYWRKDLGAHVVRGEIRERWFALGAEREGLGYPINDETVLPDGGRFSVFEGGSIYWAPGRVGSPAFEVRGAIRDTWAQHDWERGPLGYPTSGEFEVPGGIQSNFQRGSIVWNRANNEARAFF